MRSGILHSRPGPLKSILRGLAFAAGILLLTGALCDTGGDGPTEPDPTGDPLSFTAPHINVLLTGEEYHFLIAPSGGTPPYAYSHTGNMPFGMYYRGYERQLELYGTPVAAGSYVFSMTVADQDDDEVQDTITLNVAQSLDLAGEWTFTVTLTEADGSCAALVGQPIYHVVIIEEDAGVLTVSGFGGVQEAQLGGSVLFDERMLSLFGQYAEGDGTVDADYWLNIRSLSRLEGVATWDYTGGAAPCTNCRADVVAVRSGG